MSRIGKKPILIPDKVEAKIDKNTITVKGSKGELSYTYPEEISVKQDKDKLVVEIQRKTKQSSALWGLTRALIQNNVTGVSQGFEKKLEVIGVGYKVNVQKDVLKLEVGYSHDTEVKIPEGLEVKTEKNVITISGIDRQKVGQFAAEIRRIRPPEPYKGKGIRYLGEKVRRKEGKKATGAGA